MDNKFCKVNKFYSGWAMDSYPEMNENDIEFHVKRQLKSGANFVWMGHNNPGIVDAEKIEPGFSYSVYEAYIDEKDSRHDAAVKIVDAQLRLLDYCLKKSVPVVLPIGYQIQMGVVWNKKNPGHLRQLKDGSVIDWGGVSACFYSPLYRENIRVYYKWMADNVISKYRSIIILVNLADEPFGGDYSRYAEDAFKKECGLSFDKAAAGSEKDRIALGQFQSNYIVEYGSWSAEAWHEVCPDIPSTMSFCGHHGREENVMPSIPAIFRNTPEYFHPTFDAYPRDGSQKNSVKEDDVSMLTLFLRQIAYLSNLHKKPYWLWTTGNSWGLGQSSPDRANITDAIINQIMTVTTAVENGGLLNGFAIWNYNIKCQGLYNDTVEPIYNIDEMFSKLTKMIGKLRYFAMRKGRKFPDIAIVAEHDYSCRFISDSGLSTWIRPFPFMNFKSVAKNNLNVLMDDKISEISSFCESENLKFPSMLIYLSDGTISPGEKEITSLVKSLSLSKKALIPEKLMEQIKDKGTFSAEIITYDVEPLEISEEMLNEFTGYKNNSRNGFFYFNLDDLKIIYNLTGDKSCFKMCEKTSDKKFSHLTPSAEIKNQGVLNFGKTESMEIDHHELAFISGKSTGDHDAVIDTIISAKKEN
jgi:hypothetical protein